MSWCTQVKSDRSIARGGIPFMNLSSWSQGCEQMRTNIEAVCALFPQLRVCVILNSMSYCYLSAFFPPVNAR